MIAIFHGTYIAFGPETAPRVVYLDERARSLFADGLILIEKYPRQRDYLYAQTFGPGIDTAFAAWDRTFMELIAKTFDGPHWQRVRQLAAAIVLGVPFEELDKKSGKDGGLPVRQPRQPVKPKPGGIALAPPV